MNLDTTPAPIRAGRFHIILTGEEPTERKIMAFDVETEGFPTEAFGLLNDVIRAFEGPYALRGYSAEPIFSDYRQSVVNLIGGIRESIETDFRYALWGVLTAAGFHGDGWSVNLKEQTREDVIRVAFDGNIHLFNASIVRGPEYREGCSTCQDGANLLRIALNEINGAVIVDGKTVIGAMADDPLCYEYEYGKYNVLCHIPGDTKLVVSNPRDFTDGVSSFPDWFRWVNVGARDMASSEVYFSLI